MKQKYFLYIDILGFADLVKQDPSEIEKIYEIINSLNVHSHDTFKTIVFSDTILVYNKVDVSSQHDHEYVVMYACEFVQDLMYRFADKKRHFRAILTYDNFKHYNLKNVECYYGDALVNSYYKEKDVNGIGLFIDKRIAKYNKIFPTTEYDKDLQYVCLLQCVERLNRNTGGVLPTNDLVIIDETDEYWAIKFELNILRDIFNNSIKHSNVKVRSKFLQTYQLYKNMFRALLLAFEDTNFDVTTINPKANWSEKQETYD